MLELKIDTIDTPSGALFVVTDMLDTVRALDWVDCEERMRRLLNTHYDTEGFSVCPLPVGIHIRNSLSAYFAGELTALDALPTHTNGTPFQQKVWSALRLIPPGQTRSYQQLAMAIQATTSVRAVGAANGANPIPLIVPCHRVIGADLSLTGFGGGMQRKRWLLEHEGLAVVERRGRLFLADGSRQSRQYALPFAR